MSANLVEKVFNRCTREKSARSELSKEETAVSAKITTGAHGMQNAMWNSRKHARAENSPSPAFVLMRIVTILLE
jgi:hypothetical protein